MKRVVVVGGGLAGLAAAHRLTTLDSSINVSLFEATDRTGGNIRTSTFAGAQIDEAADAFLVRVPWATDLCAELGLNDLVHPSGLPAAIWHDRELRPLPKPNVMGIPLSPEPLRASGLVSESGIAALIADLAGHSPILDFEDSVGRLLRARLGDEIVDNIVDPLLGGVYANPSDELSLSTVVPQLAHAADAPSFAQALFDTLPDSTATPAPIFAAPRGGMQRLTDALTEYLGSRVEYNTSVTQLTVEATSNKSINLTVDGSSHPADAVILATPAPVTSRLLGSDFAQPVFVDRNPTSVAFVTLAFDPSTIAPLDRSGFLVPMAAGLTMTACSFTSAKWPHLDTNQAVLRAAVGRAGDDAIAHTDDATITQTVLRDLKTTMGISVAPTEVRISRWSESFPRYRPGHLDRLAQASQALAIHNIAVAGASTNGIGIPACIASGQSAAARTVDAIS